MFLPRWYRSGATLTIETGQTIPGAGSVLGLASQLGLSAGASSSSPQFYADLLSSRVLLERVLSARYPLGSDGSPETLEAYWNRGRPTDARSHWKALDRLNAHFSASANPRTGLITLTLEGPSREVVRLMADTTLAAMNDLVVTIRRRHASEERRFLEERWKALHDSLIAHEDVLRQFYERNRQVTSPQLQFEEVRLKREVELVQAVYAQISTQLEQARIQEVRDTPAISVIDPPVEPVRRSSPRLSLLILTGAVLGAALATILVLGEMAMRDLVGAHPRTTGRRVSATQA
jgi:uncharacterized protein involved in exopolysaccharide biosynthesis